MLRDRKYTEEKKNKSLNRRKITVTAKKGIALLLSAVLFAVSAGRPLKKRNTGLAPLYKNNADEACGASGTHLKKSRSA